MLRALAPGRDAVLSRPTQRFTSLGLQPRVFALSRTGSVWVHPLLPRPGPAPDGAPVALPSRTRTFAFDLWSTRQLRYPSLLRSTAGLRVGETPLPPRGQRAAPPSGVASARMPAAYQNGSVDADSDLTQSSLADPSKSAVNLPSRLVQRARPPAGRPSAGQPSAEPKYLRLRKERSYHPIRLILLTKSSNRQIYNSNRVICIPIKIKKLSKFKIFEYSCHADGSIPIILVPSEVRKVISKILRLF